jgi:hypothetical protein
MPRHPIDSLSLVLGLGFVALGVAGLGTWVDLRHADGDWLMPLGFVFVGLVLFVSLLTRPAPQPSGAGHAPPPGDDADRGSDDMLGNRWPEPGVGEGSGTRDP